jgi:hypothetical protein
MTVPETDARRFRRFSVDVEASISTEAMAEVKARTRDLSRTGICLIGSQAVERGAMLRLRLVLAFADNRHSDPLVLHARVVWCADISGSFQIGALFEEVTEVQDTFLEMFLHYLDGTLVPRGTAGREENGSPGFEEGAEEPLLSPDDKDDPFR